MADFSFPLDAPIELAVRIGHGSVTIETDDNLTTATVGLAGGKAARDLLGATSVELSGRTLSVMAPRQGGVFDLPFLGKLTGRGLDVHVRVPSGTPVRVSTFTAPIRIPGRVGNTDITFGAGEAVVRDVEGSLRMRFGSGLAKAVSVQGSVQVRSGAGNAQFGEVAGELRAGCGSGNLEVRGARGRVVSRCGSGTAKIDAAYADVDLTSGSGQLQIGLPAGITARLDLETGSGSVQSDLPIEDEPGPGKAQAITVRARAGTGDIRLFRAD